MKNLAMILLGILGFAFEVRSQDWNTDTLEWSVFDGNFLGQGSTVTFSLGSAIDLNDTTYRSLLQQPCLSPQDPQLIGFIRQSGDSIFYRYSSESSEFLFYDFSLEVGDHFGPVYCQIFPGPPESSEIVMQVVEIDTITVAGIDRRRYFFDTQVIWIEHIGSDQGLFPNELCLFDAYFDLNCVYQDSNFIYGEEGAAGTNCCFTALGTSDELEHVRIKIFPNPAFANASISIEGLSSSASFQLIDLSGRYVQDIQLNNGKVDLSQINISPGIYLLTHPELGANRMIILQP